MASILRSLIPLVSPGPLLGRSRRLEKLHTETRQGGSFTKKFSIFFREALRAEKNRKIFRPLTCLCMVLSQPPTGQEEDTQGNLGGEGGECAFLPSPLSFPGRLRLGVSMGGEILRLCHGLLSILLLSTKE